MKDGVSMASDNCRTCSCLFGVCLGIWLVVFGGRRWFVFKDEDAMH